MKSIDFKSLLIGILGTLLVIACTAAKTNMRFPSKNGEPGTYAVACSGAEQETKNTQKSLPKYRFWKAKCFKIAFWSLIFYPSRFWSQNGTTALVHPNHFLRFWLPQGEPKTAKNQ